MPSNNSCINAEQRKNLKKLPQSTIDIKLQCAIIAHGDLLSAQEIFDWVTKNLIAKPQAKQNQ